jgi:S1-C subfamily serine protease
MQASWLWAAGMVLLEMVGTPRPSQQVVRGPATQAVRGSGRSDGRVLSQGFTTVARAIAPSVVRLEVSGADDVATASGIVLDTRGNVVTSSHAFDGCAPGSVPAGSIAVVLADGRRLPAELVGLDSGSEVAVVRMVPAPGDLTAARFGDSDGPSVGDWVLAVGNPLGLDQTITAGIISSRPDLDGDALSSGRYLLTDASVNPGESGGPLVDLEGEVVGLTTAISAGPGGSYGYAIPINRVRRTAVVLLREGHALHPSIGIGVRDPRDLDAGGRRVLGATPRGALVSRVLPGAPAARAGLRAGDLITSVDDRDVPDPADLVALISRKEIGAEVVLGYVRNGDDRVARLLIADLPWRADLPAPVSPGETARP